MRITEITRPASIITADQLLANKGYRRIGMGGAGRVFHREGETTVLKLFETFDTGYVKFVDYTIANPSPYWPKWRSKLISVTEDYSAIRMELLSPITQGMTPDAPIFQANTLIRWADWYIEYSHSNPIRKIAHQIDKKYRELRNPSIARKLDLLDQDQPGLREDLAKLIDSFGPNQFDLIISNIMLRGNTLVITDPMYDFDS